MSPNNRQLFDSQRLFGDCLEFNINFGHHGKGGFIAPHHSVGKESLNAQKNF